MVEHKDLFFRDLKFSSYFFYNTNPMKILPKCKNIMDTKTTHYNIMVSNMVSSDMYSNIKSGLHEIRGIGTLSKVGRLRST